jgi:two-component system sensor histidine kinase PilS (NtrC family)
VALGVGLARGWISPPYDQLAEAYSLSSTELYSAGLFNILGLLLVTMLASGLATRLQEAGGRLKRAEAGAMQLARLNDDIVRSLSSGLLTTDLQGRIRTVNPIAAQLFDVEESDLVGKPVETLLPTTMPEDKRIFQAEGKAARPDGSRFPVGYSITPLINEDGSDVGQVMVFQDLTELSVLRDTAKRAERLAILGRLSAGLAHEIRNPLNSISGSVELVRESSRLDDQERRLLNVVLAETDRLNELVTTMLQVGRPVSPRHTESDLRGITDEVVEMARQGPATAAGVTIETRIPEQPVTAWVDAGQVKQVLWNLVKNALQASPHGTSITVSVAANEKGGVTLEVSDQGVGLEPGPRERLFDMFYSERTHGAGIGLALVRQIVDAHGGSIDVKSSPDSGATFRVTFPARKDVTPANN